MAGSVWTIGYEQVTQAALVECLGQASVEILADVRYLPLSRRPGFSKNSLRAAVEEAGIGYCHFRHLGTPSEGRAAARRGDLATLERIYSGQLELPEALAQMAELRALAETSKAALLCYERRAAECHRNLLVTALFDDFEQIDLEPELVRP
ncbi:DUF488 family protein [Pelagerythrobacter marensis]|uniref:DUF488 domain-containing protein n=1 Tax=Pelagerythrobacter marensis TaxID=543877 RepID=A0A0G3X6B9_9SPHN|nr:DUF488 domain-containing protein [Pelagerythrobacter marensis]AKM07075.1 hypothetical protein AM2010_999 [Pelagerythrobacter marensis]